jgi:hypothetical protein
MARGDAIMANKHAGPTAFPEYAGHEWLPVKELIRTKLGDPVILTMSELEHLKHPTIRPDPFQVTMEWEFSIDHVLRIMGQLPAVAKQLINDVIAGRREKRTRPKAETHRNWKVQHDKGMSYERIAVKHHTETGQPIHWTTVKKGIDRLVSRGGE